MTLTLTLTWSINFIHVQTVAMALNNVALALASAAKSLALASAIKSLALALTIKSLITTLLTAYNNSYSIFCCCNATGNLQPVKNQQNFRSNI